jgi:hypothetical protein
MRAGSCSCSTARSVTCGAIPPGRHAGILVLRPGAHDPDSILALIGRLMRTHPLDELRGCVVVVEPRKVRIRRPDTDEPTCSPQARSTRSGGGPNNECRKTPETRSASIRTSRSHRHDPRMPSPVAARVRTRPDTVPDRTAALHDIPQPMVAVPARPQPQVPRVRHRRTQARHPRPPRRDRPRPHQHLLG